MSAPYLLRLFCLSMALFFFIHVAIGSLISAATPGFLRFAERLKPQLAATLLLRLRLLPSAFAALVIIAFGIPSFFRFEPLNLAEPVGFLCLAAAALGGCIWIASICKAVHALLLSIRYVRQCERAGRWAQLPGEPASALVLETAAPFLLIAGVFHPRLIVSTGLMSELSETHWIAALRHEQAHRISRDNFKRLLLLAAPPMFPWSGASHALDRAWAGFAEWAADDYAAHAERNGSLHLAEGLTRLARLGNSVSLPLLTTPLFTAGSDLAARIERLLNSQQNPPTSARLRTAPFLLLCFLVCALALNEYVLARVHAALEFLIR